MGAHKIVRPPTRFVSWTTCVSCLIVDMGAFVTIPNSWKAFKAQLSRTRTCSTLLLINSYINSRYVLCFNIRVFSRPTRLCQLADHLPYYYIRRFIALHRTRWTVVDSRGKHLKSVAGDVYEFGLAERFRVVYITMTLMGDLMYI